MSAEAGGKSDGGKPGAPPAGEPKPKPAKAPVPAQEEFLASMDNLMVKARAAGVRPLQAMVAAYAQQGMAMLDGLLGALDGEGAKKAAPAKKKATSGAVKTKGKGKGTKAPHA